MHSSIPSMTQYTGLSRDEAMRPKTSHSSEMVGWLSKLRWCTVSTLSLLAVSCSNCQRSVLTRVSEVCRLPSELEKAKNRVCCLLFSSREIMEEANTDLPQPWVREMTRYLSWLVGRSGLTHLSKIAFDVIQSQVPSILART